MTPGEDAAGGRHRPRLIAGSGRSGTTWVLDVLAEANGLRTVFEPLHPCSAGSMATYERRFVDPLGEAPDLEAFLSRVFDGRFRSTWSDFRVRPDRLRPRLAAFGDVERCKQYFGRWRKLYRNRRRFSPALKRPGPLVKSIRANLMLGWLRECFDARILLVVRHPGAVVESQLRLGGDWDPYRRLDWYRNDAALVARYGGELAFALQPDLSRVEALTAIWAIENKHAVEQAAMHGYEVIFYEDLRAGPDQAWRRAIDCLGLEAVPAPTALRSPSQQTDAQHGARQFAAGLDTGWLERIGAPALDAVQRVLDATGIGFFEAGDPRPRSPRRS